MSGSAIFSVEVELGWGYHDLQRSNKYATLSESRDAETEALERLLTFCDKFEIPITFDVVGHLILNDCPGTHHGKHPTDWFRADPGTDVKEDPLFYAPDLIEMIEAAEVDHEVCTHTFSHALGEEFSSGQLVSDLKKAQDLHRDRFGHSVESIVPPRHQQMDPEILKQNGIRVIRQTAGKMPETKPALLRWYFSQNHPVMDPARDDGLITTYTSVTQSMTAPYIAHGQGTVHPVLRSIPLRVRKHIHHRYVKNALERAAMEDKHAHFWTHLHDMANEAQLAVVKQCIKTVSEQRCDKNLETYRMCDLQP
jgi:hypothetical protein